MASNITFPCVLESLEEPRQATLEFVLTLGVQVAELYEDNQMTITDFAMCMIPCLCVGTPDDGVTDEVFYTMDNQRGFLEQFLLWWRRENSMLQERTITLVEEAD